MKCISNHLMSMFSYCTGLESIKFGENFETDNVTSLEAMFISCENLKTLDLSYFNTSSVTYMQYMFNNCTSLETLDLSNCDTSSVTNMSNIFAECPNLISLDLDEYKDFWRRYLETNYFLLLDYDCLLVFLGFKTSKYP